MSKIRFFGLYFRFFGLRKRGVYIILPGGAYAEVGGVEIPTHFY